MQINQHIFSLIKKLGIVSCVFMFFCVGCKVINYTLDNQQKFVIMFYNLENMFDTVDSPDTNDTDFTPEGNKHWTIDRYEIKKRHIWQVIASTDTLTTPDIIGVCEIENCAVLQDILATTPLGNMGYSYYYHETQDRRGIDIAVLYKRESFTILDTTFVPIYFPTAPDYHSRDIIYVKGIATQFGDTLHIFVNHWPSRFSGRIASEQLRITAAYTLKHLTDSVLNVDAFAKIVCIGDFNDTPLDRSVNDALKAYTSFDTIRNYGIYNLAYYMQIKKGMWTYNYQGGYDILDQIFVSGGLMLNRGLCCTKDDATTVYRDFLVEQDNNGVKPKRTYNGFKYNKGFSDHLPVMLYLHSESSKN